MKVKLLSIEDEVIAEGELDRKAVLQTRFMIYKDQQYEWYTYDSFGVAIFKQQSISLDVTELLK